jgi:hypothetical protein
MKAKTVLNSVKPYAETFGLIKDIGELVALVAAAVKFITWDSPVGWSLLLSLNWVIGCVAFWLVLGPVAPIFGLLASVLAPVSESLVPAPPQCNRADPICAAAWRLYEEKRQDVRSRSSFETVHWAAIIALVIFGIIAAKAEKSGKAKHVPIIVYGVLFSGIGVWYAFTHSPSPRISDDLIVRLVGLAGMILIAYHGGALVARGMRRMKSLSTSDEKPKE